MQKSHCATIRKNRLVTIPSFLLNQAKLGPGDMFQVSLEEEGLVLTPVRDYKEKVEALHSKTLD